MYSKNSVLIISLIVSCNIFALQFQPSDLAWAGKQVAQPVVLAGQKIDQSYISKEGILTSPAFQVFAVSFYVDHSDGFVRYAKQASWYGNKQKTSGELFGNHVMYPAIDFIIGEKIFKTAEFNNVAHSLGQSLSHEQKQFAVENSRLIVGAALTRFAINMVDSKCIDRDDCKKFAQCAASQVALNALDQFVITPTVKSFVTTNDYNAQEIAAFGANFAVVAACQYFFSN